MLRDLIAILVLCVASAAHAGEVLSLSVASASVEPDPADRSRLQVHIRFGEGGRRSFAAFTSAHVRQSVRVLVDGSVASAPMRVLTPITGGAMSFYPVPPDQAENTARRLSSGSAAFGVELLP